MANPWGLVQRGARAARLWLTSLVSAYHCTTCGKPLRRLVPGDLTPEAVRSHRLAGTLGGLMASAYVCRDCTRSGEWVLIERHCPGARVFPQSSGEQP